MGKKSKFKKRLRKQAWAHVAAGEPLSKDEEKALRKAWKKSLKKAAKRAKKGKRPMDSLTPEQEKLLKGLKCDGCGRHCPLTSPRCKNGRRRASEVLAGAPAVRERVVYDTFEEYLAAQAAKKQG